MKTLFFSSILISIFCACYCYGLTRQPRPNRDNLIKESYADKIIEKCREMNADIRKSNFLDQDTLLCFGLTVLSQQFPSRVEASTVIDGVEMKSDIDICKHFQEMKLNSTLVKLNESVAVYNLQFIDKDTCERACLDVMKNVNPLCSFILLLSRHLKGNLVGGGMQVSTTTLPGEKADDDNRVSNTNVVREQSRPLSKEVPKNIPDKQKPEANGAGGVNDKRKTEVGTQEQKLKGQQLLSKHVEDESRAQNPQIIPQEQTSRGIMLERTDDINKLQGQKQTVSETGTGSGTGKPKETSEEGTVGAKEESATSAIQEEKSHITPNINITSHISKPTANLEDPKETTEEDIKSTTKNENQGKSESLPEKKIPGFSSVVLPKSSGGDNNEQAVVTSIKAQEQVSSGEGQLTSQKVVADKGLQKEDNFSHLQNIEEGKDIDIDQKPQTDNNENPKQKVVDSQIPSKTIIEVITKSNTYEQKTNQNKGKAHTNENAVTAPQSGRDDTQKMAGEEMPFTDDTGDGLAELDTRVSVEAGESNDNTEFTSGGGTGVDYARPGSDVLDIDQTEMDAGRVLIREKYEDDDSHFFAYFMTTMVFCIVGYLLFHNKQKILALALEGRARRGRRRPNTSGYRKLDSNLEEAISSSKSASVTQVIY